MSKPISHVRLRTAYHKPQARRKSSAQPLNAEGQQRVLDHLWIARFWALRFYRKDLPDISLEDLDGEAYLALVYASSMFQADFGRPFSAYASVSVRRRLHDWIRTWRGGRTARRKSVRRENEPMEPMTDESQREPGLLLEDNEFCTRIRQVMPSEWYEALRMYHVEGRTLKEVGKQCGLSAFRASRMLEAAAIRVRQLLLPASVV